MRTYTAGERCMILLFAPLGEERPLRPSAFTTLERMLLAMGQSGGDRSAELDRAELRRLGLGEADAELVLRRLERTDALDRFLSNLADRDIRVITRISPEYPKIVLERLGRRAPFLLYCAGPLSLFQRESVALVGSRQLREPGRAFASALGRAAAEQGLCYVSGGAAGADTEGFSAAWAYGGAAVLFLPDSLLERQRQMRNALDEGRLLLVSEDGPDLRFSIPRAYSRNRLIHTMGRKVFVAQTTYGQGGTWQGTLENLKRGWSPVYMCGAEPEDQGTRALIARGCQPVSLEELEDLRAITPAQTSIF